MSSNQMDALIVRHLSDIDAAARRLSYELEAKVGKAIDVLIEEWAEKSGWEGSFSWDQVDLYFYPKEWEYTEEGSDEPSQYGYFYLYSGPGDNFDDNAQVDYFWLTRLCGAGRGELAFWWEYEKGTVAPKGKKWKQFVNPYIERLKAAGFNYHEDDGIFYRPVRVDAESLAKAVENESIEDALKPIEAALEACLAAQPIFDEILTAAKSHFKAAA
ncbi:hypothetical protein IC232_03715 [Microvirga sp. BT688]|uniref:hypothetical protein n=1 Tax=Microvirga sp. TaxID=1873136 RepID=UPI00168354F6|nr:hypothetical protein [Microvirga sp.]MBD2745798.1 hypothetical protein [Microvirga sp.]